MFRVLPYNYLFISQGPPILGQQFIEMGFYHDGFVTISLADKLQMAISTYFIAYNVILNALLKRPTHYSYSGVSPTTHGYHLKI